MNPVDLGRITGTLGRKEDRNLLVGFETGDDAAVYKVREDLAIIQTIDFFTPIVDDPYSFGQIGAANALSDVYAMGGKPLTALNIVCFPSTLDLAILQEILRGGEDKVFEAGALIAGGHTIEDQEPKYGLSVLGLIHPRDLITNAKAFVNDALILTKPIGGGILSTALKKGFLHRDREEEMIKVMATLNDRAAMMMKEYRVSSCTDITGFGLLGHAYEMARESNVSLDIYWDKVPLFSGTEDLVEEGIYPGGTKKNLLFLKDKVEFSASVSPNQRLILCDAMTSGGLLMAAPEEKKDSILEALLRDEKTNQSAIIGQVRKKGSSFIYVY